MPWERRSSVSSSPGPACAVTRPMPGRGCGGEPYAAERGDGVDEVAFVVDEDGSGLAQGRPGHAPGGGQGAGVGAGEVADVAAAHDQGHHGDTIGQAAYRLGEAAAFTLAGMLRQTNEDAQIPRNLGLS